MQNQKKRKVCFIAAVHQTPFNIRVFYKEAKSLSENGYAVSLIVQHDKKEEIDGVKILPLPKPRFRLYRMTVHAYKALRIARQQKADIYHIHSPELLPVALLLKLSTGKKIIYDVHEDFPRDFLTKEWIPKVLRKIISETFAGFEKICCRYIDYIIPATESIAEHFPLPNKEIINNYPFIALVQEDVRSHLERKSKNRLVYAGDLSAERGVRELIQSLGFIDKKYNPRLSLIGRYSNSAFQREIEKIDSFRLVDYFAWMPFSEVIDRYKESDIGMLLYLPRPNHISAMPNKLFEYMALGLPIISSNFPLWKKIVEGNGCGITVDPLKPREIGRAIGELLGNEKLRVQMGQNGRRAVREKYNWEIEKEKLLSIYVKLLG